MDRPSTIHDLLIGTVGSLLAAVLSALMISGLAWVWVDRIAERWLLIGVVGAGFLLLKVVCFRRTSSAASRKISRIITLVASGLWLVFLGNIALLWLSGDGPRLNEFFTRRAWEAFNKGEYEKTISNASFCVRLYRSEAGHCQDALALKQVASPPSGVVPEANAKLILSRGPLNDVATCLYITGLSLERLERYGEAKRIYRDAQMYTYARTWDSRGYFWSPAEQAGQRLAVLQRYPPPER